MELQEALRIIGQSIVKEARTDEHKRTAQAASVVLQTAVLDLHTIAEHIRAQTPTKLP